MNLIIAFAACEIGYHNFNAAIRNQQTLTIKTSLTVVSAKTIAHSIKITGRGLNYGDGMYRDTGPTSQSHSTQGSIYQARNVSTL